ncbi:MAG: hypothetical protein ABIR30_14245 [Chitinophagaceae bacterium]
MRTKFLYTAIVLFILSVIYTSCVSQRKTGCVPERARKEIKFKGFL